MPFVKAKREKTKARVAFQGPTNCGKSYSSLVLAHGLIIPALEKQKIEPTTEEIQKRIAFIDTERRRGRFYANRDDLPTKTGEFYWMELNPPYTPDKYIAAVQEGAELVGENGVVIVDSLSHAWSGSGGLLDIKQQIEKQANKNSYTAWNDAGKLQNKLIDSLMSLNCHTIVTMRSKMEYSVEKDENTKKTTIQQVGVKPIQRDETEYEFDIVFQLEKQQNTATIVKDTTFLKSIADEDQNIGVITEHLGKQLYKWLNEGLNTVDILEEERLSKIKEIQQIAKESNLAKNYYKQHLHPGKPSKELSLMEARNTLASLYEFMKKNKEKQKENKGDDL